MTEPKSLESQIKSLSKSAEASLDAAKREAEFATQANERFTKNLACFSKYYPDIAKAIQEYKVEDDFCIHVEKDGFANIDVVGKDVRFYSAEPSKQISEQVARSIKAPKLTLTEYTTVSADYKDTRVHIRYMRELGAFLRSAKESGEPDRIEQLPAYFPTAMIFGVGLGYHIPMLLEHTQFDYTFIIEPDFKLFFASVFCIDWAAIVEEADRNGNCIFLFIGCKPDELITELKRTTENIGAFSIVRSFCYQHYPLASINESIANFFRDYFQFQFGHGFYNDAVTGLAHSYMNVKKGVHFYDAKRKPVDSLKDVPVFIVGNGPSLDQSQEFLLKNKGKGIIFACGTALTTLINMGIQPDFHILVERPYRNYQAVLDMASKEEYSKLNLLGVNTIYPDTMDLYNWVGLSLKGNEAGTDFVNVQLAMRGEKGLSTTAYSNPLVANTGLSYALHLGFKNIYLFGIDNGRSASGASHSKLSIYNQDQGDRKFKYQAMGSDGSFLPGNLGGTVETNDTYRMSNRQLEELIALKPAVVMNIGDGAYIKGAIPTDTDNLFDLEDNLNKAELIETIKSEFVDLQLEDLDFSRLGKELIIEAFDHLSTIAKEEVSTVHEASENLKRQERYLYAFRGTRFSHIFHIIKGSLLYYHCPMVTNLFKYKSEDESLRIYLGLNQRWLEYLAEMKAHFVEKGLDKCDWELY